MTDHGASRELARWLLCGAVVVAAHGGAAGMLATWSEPAPPGIPQAAILLDLDADAAAPPAPKSDAAPAEQDSQASDFIPEPIKKIEVEREPLEPPKQVAELPPDPVPEPPPEPPRKQAEVVLPPPKPPVAKPVERKRRTAAIDQRRAHQEKVADHVSSAAAGASGAIKASYNQRIVAHLNRYKSYPQQARDAGARGVVMVSFTLDRNGRVVASRLARSSGHSALDREALDLVKRAQPFPTPPAELAGAQFPFTAPMRYDLAN